MAQPPKGEPPECDLAIVTQRACILQLNWPPTVATPYPAPPDFPLFRGKNKLLYAFLHSHMPPLSTTKRGPPEWCRKSRTQRFLATHPRCPLRGRRVYGAKRRCDTPLLSGPPIGGLLYFEFLSDSYPPAPLRHFVALFAPLGSVSLDSQVALLPYESSSLAT